MGRRRAVTTAVALLVAVGLILGAVSGAFAAWTSAGLHATGLWSSNGASTVQPSQPATPVVSGDLPPAPGPDLPGAVLPAVEPTAAPDADAVAARVRGIAVKDALGSYSAAVLDVGTGTELYARSADKAYIPASTMKLLTGAAALALLGPQHRFSTSVVAGAPGQIILVGGGDPYLAKKTSATTFPERASIADLAAATATELKAAGTKTVKLGYDSSLFSGPGWNPLWPSFYSDQVTVTSALWVDRGRVSPGSPGPRYSNPPRRAAEAFAAELKRRGITVTATASARAPASAATIAQVLSMPLDRIVEQLLMVSDNDTSEVLLRHVGLASGASGSIADGAAAVRAELRKLGVWEQGSRIADGSGLARQTKVPAATLARLLRLAASDEHPELRALVTGLPVAGVEGSLRIRFYDDQSLAGRGVVRGKTGTLRKVHSLAGLIRTRDGSLLAYAFVINNPKNDFASTVWLDRVTTALSRCGCA